MTLVSKTFELYGKTYTFESGELAKQATGACLVKQGDTTMLDTVVVSKERKNYDFFPLTVDFNEKMYAAGRIPGGYLKREGRPSEKATLTARMIDRPIRPSFPDGFRNEVHVVATSLVADQVNPFDVINVISKPKFYENDYEGDGRRFYTDGRNVHKYLKELVAAGGIDGMITVGEMSSTTLENCIGYTAEGNHELTMCFNFHHLKVDYKNGQKWELMPPDHMALKKLFQTWQEGMQAHGGWNALFWCNHDQPRAVSRFGSDTTYWKESAEMLAAAIHFMRGTPYIYQGEELGMTNPHFTKIEQYRDVESLNYYRILREQGKTEAETLDIIAQRSRDDSRTPMQWNSSENAGFTTGTPWIGLADNYKAINAAAEVDDPDSVRSFYKMLVHLRKTHKVISEGKIEFLYPDNADLLAYRRYGAEDGEELLVLCNLTEHDAPYTLPEGWADADKLLGNYPDRNDALRPYECLILTKA